MAVREQINSCDTLTDWSTTESTNFALTLEETLQSQGAGCLKIAATSGSCLGETVLNAALGGVAVTDSDTIKFKVRSDKTGTKIRCFLKNRNPVLCESFGIYDEGTLANGTNDWVLTGTGSYQHRINSAVSPWYDLVTNASGTISSVKEFESAKSGEIDFITNQTYSGTAHPLVVTVKEGSDIICRTQMNFNTNYYVYDTDLANPVNVNDDRTYTRLILKWADDDTYEVWACLSGGTPALVHSGDCNNGMTDGADSITLTTKAGSSYNYWRLKDFNCNTSARSDTPEIYQDIEIAAADTWQDVEFDISGWELTDKDDIQGILFQCIDDSADFDFYIDDIYVYYEMEEEQWCATDITDDDIFERSNIDVYDGDVTLGYNSETGGWNSYGSNLLTNPGAEDGDTTGWTSIAAFGVTTEEKRTGTYSFGNAEAGYFGGYQDVDVSSYAAQIAKGAVWSYVSAWQKCTDPWYDAQKSSVIYLNSDGKEIQIDTIGWYHGYDKEWKERISSRVIPLNTETIRLKIEGKMSFSGGSYVDSFFDDCMAKLRFRDYYSSGYFIIEKEFENRSEFGDITFNTDGTQTCTVKVQTSEDGKAWVDWDDVSAVTSGTDISGETYVTDGDRYMRFRIDMSTDDTTETPTFEDLCINYRETETPCPCSATQINEDVYIEWTDTLSGEEAFSLERQTDSGDFAVIHTADPGETSYLDVAPTKGHIYTYRVRALREGIYSYYCTTNSIDMTSRKHILFCVSDELREFFPGDGSTSVLNYYDEGKIDVTQSSKIVYASGTVIDDCETIWTAEDANIVASLDAVDYQVGSNSTKLVVDAAATADQVLAYRNYASAVDCSALKTLHVWIKSSVNTAAGDLQIRLYDTADKTNEVMRFDIPALTLNTWTKCYIIPLLYDEDYALDSINCTALYQVTDLGACSLWLDDIKIIAQEWTANVEASDIISIDSFTTEYVVDSVDSSGKITLTENYAGATATDQDYKIKYPLAENIPCEFTTFNNRVIGTNYADYPFEYDPTNEKFYRQLIEDTPDISGVSATEDTTGTLASGVYLYAFAPYSSDLGLTSETPSTEVTVTTTSDKRVIIAGLPRLPWRYDKWKIYRTNAGETTYYYHSTIDARMQTFYDDTADTALDTNEVAPIDGEVQVYAKHLGVHAEKLILAHTKDTEEYRSRFLYSNTGYNNLFDTLDYVNVNQKDGDEISGIVADYLDSIWIFKQKSIYAIYGKTSFDWTLMRAFSFIGTKSPRSIINGLDHRLYYLGSDGHIRRLAGARSEVSESISNVQTDKLTIMMKDTVDSIDLSKLYLCAGIEYDGKMRETICTSGNTTPDKTIVFDYEHSPERAWTYNKGYTSFLKTDDDEIYATDGVNNYIYQLEVEDLYTDDDVPINFKYKTPAFQIAPGTDQWIENIKVQYDSASTGTLYIRVYTEGTLSHTETVDLSTYTDSYGFNPPRIDTKGRYQQIEIEETSGNAFKIVNLQFKFRTRTKSYN